MLLLQKQGILLYFHNIMGNNTSKHSHLIPKICISGASETGHCGVDALEKAKTLGREIANHGAMLLNGATTGFPLWSAMGAKEVKGITVGFSPASNETEHVETYRLPVDYLDLVVYTGFGITGRSLLLTRSADAVIVACGRIGTINEFTSAFENGKPIGVLEGGWSMDETIHKIITDSEIANPNIVFDSDPVRLVATILEMVKKRKMNENVK